MVEVAQVEDGRKVLKVQRITYAPIMTPQKAKPCDIPCGDTKMASG